MLVNFESHPSEERVQASLYVKIAAFRCVKLLSQARHLTQLSISNLRLAYFIRFINTAIIVTLVTPFSSTLGSGTDDLIDGVKDIFRHAATETLNVKDKDYINDEISGIKRKVRSALKLARAGRGETKVSVHDIASTDSALGRFCDDSLEFVSDTDGLFNHISELTQEDIRLTLIELDKSKELQQSQKKRKRSILEVRARPWRNKRKAVSFSGIRDCEGEIAFTPESIGKLLQEHWGRVFAPKEIDPEEADFFLDYSQAVPDGFRWGVDLDAFLALLDATHDSAPGPDGVPYSAWKRSPPCCKEETL